MNPEQNQQFQHYLNTCERPEDSTEDSTEESSDNDDSTYDDTSEEENPLPQWNLPNWQGNASGTVCPCIKQVVADGSIRGCAECDEYWDMPSLVGDADQIQCEGCYLLENGLGGENQMAHTCMEHF